MSHQQSFSYVGTGFNVLAQGHNVVMPVGLEPAAPRSRVKHSTTEPLRPKKFALAIKFSSVVPYLFNAVPQYFEKVGYFSPTITFLGRTLLLTLS